ncbi:MAG: hypothetical protein IPP40_07545 [bacterium]|nr:hypothetical protein [bacterium]
MKKLLLFSLFVLAAAAYAEPAVAVFVDDSEYQIEQAERDFTKRIVFEKYLWAEGVDPQRRHLDHLMVKFFDEDTVRIRNGEMVSLTDRDISFTKGFLSRHPEIKPRVIIFNKTEEEYTANLVRIEKQSGRDLVDLFSFYCFEMENAATSPRDLIDEILRAPEVETAYFEPIPVDLTCTDVGNTTPNFRPEQTYHDPAPLGVDLGGCWRSTLMMS